MSCRHAVSELLASQSIEAVALWQFVVATFVVFPKLALHVFIGTRLASLSDGQQRKHMDTRESGVTSFEQSLTSRAALKIMNISAVVGGILVSIVASWYVKLRLLFHRFLNYPFSSG